jgi:PadR family transcriptional regulator PadR
LRVGKELLKGTTVILILSLLDERPMYGYEMIKAIEEKSSGTFSFKEGTLYPILHSLEAEGMVESYWDDSTGNRQRKYYRLTPSGQIHARAKKAEWKMYKKAVDQVLGEALLWT